jgi:hypothetical protein
MPKRRIARTRNHTVAASAAANSQFPSVVWKSPLLSTSHHATHAITQMMALTATSAAMARSAVGWPESEATCGGRCVSRFCTYLTTSRL